MTTVWISNNNTVCKYLLEVWLTQKRLAAKRLFSVNWGILTSCCPAVITDRRKNSGWRHFVFPRFLPVLFRCPFVNSDVQSLSARRANQHLVTFKMTIWVSVKFATSLCLTATHYLKTNTKYKSTNLKVQTCMQSAKLTTLGLRGGSEIEDISFHSSEAALLELNRMSENLLLQSLTKCQLHLIAK